MSQMTLTIWSFHIVRLKEEVNRLDEEGFSALHYAARDEKPDIVKELLAAGAGQ